MTHPLKPPLLQKKASSYGWLTCMVWLFVWLPVLTQAATYTLPSGIRSNPFSNCSLTSGTSYSCSGSITIGDNNTVNITAPMTINVSGNFEAGNSVTINSNGNAVSWVVGGNFLGGSSLNMAGNITSGSNIQISSGTVTGNITAGGNLSLGSTTVIGTCTPSNARCTPATPTLSIASVSKAEGDSGTSTMTFTITQSASSASPTSVNYATTAGTATAGSSCTTGVDYITASGTATIAAGTTTKTFTVTICGDTTIETDETFTVTLSAASNATISTATATGTIINDDLCTCVPKNGNLIANPDFEELCASTVTQTWNGVNGGTVNMRNGMCGWNMNGAGMETWENTTTTPASSGTAFVEIDGYAGNVDCLWQYVATTPGTAYTLKVDYRARTTSQEGLIVKWNGTQKYSTLATPTSAWMTITVPSLTATGNDRIEFCEPSASDNSLGSWIDNVRLQTFFPDHYEVSVPSSNVACQASTVKVTACADSSRPCTNVLATPSTPTANLATSAGTLESGALTLSNGGIATTTLSYPTAADGGTATLTLSGELVPGANARTCCIGSTCSTANTCTATFKTAGFIFANTATGASATLPTQTAGTTSGTTYLRAVKTSTTTQACESALSGAQSVNWAVQCNNPTTCYANNLMSINGGTTTTVQGNPNNGVSGYTSVPMTFDASGSAPFTFNYSDVGQVTLWATKTVNSATLSGSTNAFVVKPGGFTVTSGSIKQTASPQLTNTGAADAAGNKFVKAGEAFTATVSAVTSGGTATPNFGRETVPEGVTLTVNLVAPSGGVAPALSNGAIAGASFGGAGSATVTTLAWSETGIITLTPSLTDGDYLGAGNVTGTTTGNIGRFYPDHFAVTQGATTPACGNVFSYFGQDGFGTAFTLAAQNVGNTTTRNYTGSFAKLGLSTWSNFGFAAPGLPTGSALMASATPPTGTWGPGTASVTARHQVRRPTTLTGLATNTTVSVLAVPVDSDNVTMMAAQVAASTPLRYGRLRLQNAYGSELLALTVTATTEYREASGFYVKNTDDSCTTVPVPTAGSGLTFGTGNLSAGETTASINGISSGLGTWAAGNGGLVLSRPGSGNNGFVDITLSVPDWLKFPWLGGSPVNPTAKAVFGIYKSPLIYLRENY